MPAAALRAPTDRLIPSLVDSSDCSRLRLK